MAEGRLWEFSNRVYRLEGVPDACLTLQDRHGVDVNMMLFCCWTGATIGVVSDATMSEALGYSSLWAENVVRPLRRVRRWLKSDHGESELRDEVKRVELDAERVQQDALEAITLGMAELGPGPDAVQQNLARWLDRAGITLDESGRRDLEVVVRASHTAAS
jgi:uncharacterized protein (TIGR02444 family)